MSSAERATQPLYAGQRLGRKEFLRRWEAMPEVKFAELIDGVVYMPSPQTSDHGRTGHEVDTWLGTYRAYTPGCDSGTQSTWLMLRSAPQPDSYLWILPEHGGQSGIQGKFHIGAPELAAEICLSSAAYDLGVKKLLYQKAQVREYVAILVEEEEIRWRRLARGVYEHTHLQRHLPVEGVSRSLVGRTGAVETRSGPGLTNAPARSPISGAHGVRESACRAYLGLVPGKVAQALAQGNGDLLDHVGLGLDLASFQICDHLPPDADLLREPHTSEAGFEPQRSNTPPDLTSPFRRLKSQMGAKLRIGNRA